MSEENVEVVRRHIEAWRAQDAARALSFIDPNVVLDVSRTDAIDTTAYGHEETAELFRRYAGTFEDFRWEVKHLRDLGPGMVLAVLTETGRGKGSGVPVDRPLASLYTLIDGKIVRVTTFSREEDALKRRGMAGVGDVGGERRGHQRRLCGYERGRLRTRTGTSRR